MKKLVCLLLALALCISVSAMAETSPSKTTADLMRFDVIAENQPGDPNLYLIPINEVTVESGLPAHIDHLNILARELAKLSDLGIDSYFADATDDVGHSVNLRKMMGLDEGAGLNVFEFCEVIAGGFERDCGKVTATMLFPTPYEKGEKVDVLIGIVTLLENDAYTVTWHAFKGVGVGAVYGMETHGSIRAEFTPEIVWEIENGISLLAVISE